MIADFIDDYRFARLGMTRMESLRHAWLLYWMVHRAPSLPPKDERECNAPRGIILGVVIGLAMWAGLVWLAIEILS